MSVAGKRNKGTNGGKNILGLRDRRLDIIDRDKIPDFVEVRQGFRVKVEPVHERRERWAALLAAKCASTSSLGIGFTLPFFSSS